MAHHLLHLSHQAKPRLWLVDTSHRFPDQTCTMQLVLSGVRCGQWEKRWVAIVSFWDIDRLHAPVHSIVIWDTRLRNCSSLSMMQRLTSLSWEWNQWFLLIWYASHPYVDAQACFIAPGRKWTSVLDIHHVWSMNSDFLKMRCLFTALRHMMWKNVSGWKSVCFAQE